MSQQQGLFLIPDISGYTDFVNEVELAHSVHVITELLELLIDGDRMGLEIGEIEGDAIFFFRAGPPPSLEEVTEQAGHWVEASTSTSRSSRGTSTAAAGPARRSESSGSRWWATTATSGSTGSGTSPSGSEGT